MFEAPDLDADNFHFQFNERTGRQHEILTYMQCTSYAKCLDNYTKQPTLLFFCFVEAVLSLAW